MHNPSVTHWTCVKRVLRYLKGSITHGLHFRKTANPTLHAFSDSDWAGNADDYTSTSAYIVFIGSSPISWSSKKQKTVARSSTEAEYRSVAHTTAELNWITNILQELHLPVKVHPTIYCDNIGATYLCKNSVFHSCMKDVALDFHFVRSQVARNQLRVSHVHTQDQLADSLTKVVPKKQFLLHRSKIGLHDGSSILRGHVRRIQQENTKP